MIAATQTAKVAPGLAFTQKAAPAVQAKTTSKAGFVATLLKALSAWGA
jgi:hypothetical protein